MNLEMAQELLSYDSWANGRMPPTIWSSATKAGRAAPLNEGMKR
jgi:hypothetical protein